VIQVHDPEEGSFPPWTEPILRCATACHLFAGSLTPRVQVRWWLESSIIGPVYPMDGKGLEYILKNVVATDIMPTRCTWSVPNATESAHDAGHINT